MAEAVLSTIAEAIREKLVSSAFQEIGLWRGVNDELEKLKNTVTTIEAVVREAEMRPTMSDQLKIYIKNLKEVLYDADDLLDDFSTEAMRKQVMSGNNAATLVRKLFSSVTQLFYDRNMAYQIKAIREKLDAIKDDKKFHIGEGAVQVVPRESHSYIGEKDVIGRDDDKVKIIDLLRCSNPEENPSIISIVGMGGFGKTALAQLVYNDDVMVKNHFELKLWACVSDVFDVKIIVENIIKSATQRAPKKNLGMDQLQIQLRKELGGKKYLLVLDDVWEEDRNRWLELAILLTGGAKGSWIVVTTRSHRVAKMISPVEPHTLKGLSETDSWSLFAQMAFGQGKEPTNQSIEAIGKEIVEICAGVPLAIRVMGSLLYGQLELDYWTYFKNELTHFSKEKKEIEPPPKKRKIELSKSPEAKDGILPTLKLSYNNLKPHLKNCFAYCSLFPKDNVIDVKKLIYLWMGQGFIKSSNSSRSLEQIGYEYFLSLLGRCFFQEPEEDERGEPEEDERGEIVSCKMHDLMHDLAVEVAGTESIIISSDKEIIPQNTRHVSIDSTKIPYHLLEANNKANNIRTFLLINNYWGTPYEEICAIVSKFSRLRMLVLHHRLFGYGSIRTLPESIGELKHLRYLKLSLKTLEILPSSIARLQNLLVLDLHDCVRLREWPEDIKNLVSLEHLDIDGCDSLTHMPQGLGQLTSLQKLPTFIVSKDDSVSKHYGGLNELNRLNNLRGKLRLENLEYVKNDDYKAANLEGKEHLQSLILKWEGYNGIENVDYFDFDGISIEGLQPHKNLKKLHVFCYPGERLPYWLSSLTNLVSLALSECGKVKHLPPLDGLSSLQDLSIYSFNDLEYIDCNGLSSNCSTATFFSSLKKLEINFCPSLKGWRIESMETSTTKLPPFPCLSKLNIENCPNLISMPLFPSIEGEFSLWSSSGKPLEDTMMMNSMAASMLTSSSSSPPLPLSKLKSLIIDDINDLEYLLDQGMRNLTSLESLSIGHCKGLLLSLAGEGFSGLTSLRSLEIAACPNLKSISGVFQHCTTLEKLDILHCHELDFSNDMSCQGLRSLSSLKTIILPQLVSLPKWLQHVTTLQDLRIKDCNNFTTLPDWIGSLTSLQTLWISGCSKVTSLPEGMHRLTSLRELTIFECSQLSERCRNNTGVDWPKISHIANIKIDYRMIQMGGCYQLVSTDSKSES